VGGKSDPTAQFHSAVGWAVGWGTTALAGNLFTYWILAVSIIMILEDRRTR
jgi:hypothetical protein